MSNSDLTVNSDNPVVARTLHDIAKLVGGGETAIHPAARIVETDGDMWVECDRSSQGELLFHMPQAVLPDVHLAQWKWSGTDLELSATSDADALQLELLDAHRHLYNATGKGGWFLDHHPRAVLADHPGIAGAVQSLKPTFTPDASAASFMNTRVIRRPSGGDSAALAPKLVLMPLIDALNNHPNGAHFVGKGAVSVAQVQPTESDECYAFYGHRRSDPLSVALGYGYVDPHVNVAVSGPMTLEVKGIGRVEIGTSPPHRGSPLDPPTVRPHSDGLTLSHLTFQQARPQRLQIPLQMLLQGLGIPAEKARRQANDLIRTVGDANLELLAELARAIESGQAAAESPGLSLLAAAGIRQAAIVAATCAAP